jgi:acetyl-CoA C-acetyltransferase
MREAFIVGAVRTAIGKNHGRLSKWHPIDLGAEVVDELLRRAGVPVDKVDDLIFGCVNQIGSQGLNIAHNIVLSSSLDISVPGTTVDRQGGSGLQAIHFASQAVMSGIQDVVIAGGVEVMSTVPIDASLVDGMIKGRGVPFGERLTKRYPGVQFSPFTGAEMLAREYWISREELDQFALLSHQRAAAATREGKFKDEILPLEVELEDGLKQMHDVDEGIRFESSIEKLRSLKPLSEEGIITVASSSQMSDGAAAILIASADAIMKYKLTPRARIHSLEVIGSNPVLMLEGHILATGKMLKKAQLTIEDIDLYEVNEAFGSVPLAWIMALHADINKLNVNGGAQSLGHPLGCTGARLMTTLLHELEKRCGRYGLITICEGRGTANATIIERVDKNILK